MNAKEKHVFRVLMAEKRQEVAQRYAAWLWFQPVFLQGYSEGILKCWHPEMKLDDIRRELIELVSIMTQEEEGVN